VRLDAAEPRSRLLDALGRHGLVTAWEEAMAPTLHAAGRTWQSSGDRYAELEHLLSWQISAASRRAPLVVPHGEDAVGGAPVSPACGPGELHSLPLEALDAVPEERGVPARMPGCGPAGGSAAGRCVRRTGLAAVVLWSQTRSTASVSPVRHGAAQQWGPAGARQRPLVLPAGPGRDRRTADAFPGCANLREAVRTLSGPSAAYGSLPGPSADG
jgi:hypothetical protein